MHKDTKLLDEIKNIKSKLKSGKPAVAPKPTPKQIKAWEETHKSHLNSDTKNSSIPVPPPMPDHVLLQTSKTPSVSTLPNIKFNTINQAKFLKAIEDYDLDKIKELISSNTIKIDSFGKRGKLGKTPLQYAIINDKPELAKLLIDAGANINVKTQNGRNLFELAMYNSASDQTFELLLKTNININSMDLRALSRLHNKLFSILLKPENDINTTIGKFNRTLLHQAAERNNIKKAQILINHNINVEAQDITGETALHMLKTSKMAKILLKAGSNTEAQNKLGRTPLHNAILQANKRQVNIKNIHNIVLKLIKSGANPNAVDYYGFTPLEYAIRINDSKIFKLLIKNNAKFKKNRYELFCQALESGNLTATKYLFKKEFLNNINDKNGQNYLYYIATGGNKEVLEYLVKKNHDNGKKILTQFVDKQRNTPIHTAVQNGQFEIIKNFQKLGFDINARNADGETVLHILARAQNGGMIKELIKLGADINIKNKIGKTALDKVEEDFKGISKKISNKQLQELFEESNIIARTGRIEDETKYLYQYRQDGYYKNIEREGNRGRSATLLVPDVNISLFFTGIGLLYNANDSTIRHFMPHDFWTDNARRTEDFFNMRLDNKKFVQTHSKEKFLKTYKNFLKDNPQKDYNEIIANLYPKGLIGIALQNDDLEHKLYALEAKYYVSEKYNMDLPMTIVKNKKLIPWNPTISEIKELLAKTNVENHPKYGFTYKGEELISLNKNEVTYNEVKKFFDDIDSNNTENNLQKLFNLVNNRLQNDNLSTIDDLKDFIIHKEDIKNLFVELEEKDKVIINENSKKLNKQELEDKVLTALSTMQSLRSEKDNFPQLENYKSIEDILSKELAEEKRIPSIINNLKELLQADIIEMLKQNQNYKEFKEKVNNIINTDSKKELPLLKQKLRDLEEWCDKNINTDKTHILRNFGKVVKHAILAILNAGNKKTFEREKKKINFYLHAIKDSRQNISTTVEKIRNVIKHTPSDSIRFIPNKNHMSREQDKSK